MIPILVANDALIVLKASLVSHPAHFALVVSKIIAFSDIGIFIFITGRQVDIVIFVVLLPPG